MKHLSRYLNEFQFRFNNRDCEDMFTLVILRLLIGNALRYKALIDCLDMPEYAGVETTKTQDDDDDVPF